MNPIVYTAIVTPFWGGEIDYPSFARLIENQIEAGVHGIVVAGTTGECPTLSHEEHVELVKFASRIINKRVTLIAGTGSNSTREAIALTQACQKYADIAMVVVPYYNKPTQAGIVAHYIAIHEATDIPIMIYDVPHRTGVSINTDSIMMLADLPRISSIKDASGEPARTKIISKYLNVFSGDDNLVQEFMANGAVGVVSVASNLEPYLMLRNLYSMTQHPHLYSINAIAYVKKELFTRNLITANELRLPLLPI